MVQLCRSLPRGSGQAFVLLRHHLTLVERMQPHVAFTASCHHHWHSSPHCLWPMKATINNSNKWQWNETNGRRVRRGAMLVSRNLCNRPWHHRDQVPARPWGQWRGWSPVGRWRPNHAACPWGHPRPLGLPTTCGKSCCCGPLGSKSWPVPQCVHEQAEHPVQGFSTCQANKGCSC